MADVTIYKGDVVLSEVHKGAYNLVTAPKLELLLALPLSGKHTTKVIDTSICVGTSDFFKAAIERTIYPLILIFNDGKLPFKKTDFKTKNKVTIKEGTVKKPAELFPLLELVVSCPDRTKVYETLMANKSLHHVVTVYLYDNVALFPQNTGVLSFIDMLALHKDSQRLCELLAFSFKPTSRKMYLKWHRPKKES
jgi:hypothetical protein